eukprot:TRINITY_DN12672_c0_g1_i4.p1 TRINITY_DN12672_c0_g1~~TRINITY_DN12672_c0_g1_i4.p1  ORF type:complete len:203 (-),score=37.68 TRINITY_DN12672_c0_g1_i4:26-634(-)
MHAKYREYQIHLLGDLGVGKSTIRSCYDGIPFPKDYGCSYVDFAISTMTVGGISFKLRVWDIANEKRLCSVINLLYAKAHGVIVVFDVNKRKSFENVREWVSRFFESASEEAALFLAGNKIDLKKRAVSQEEGKSMAEEFGIKYFEISAKKSVNIMEMFEEMGEELLKIAITGEEKTTVKQVKCDKCCVITCNIPVFILFIH